MILYQKILTFHQFHPKKKYCGCDQSFVTSFAVFSLYQKFLIHYQKFMIFYQKILIFHQKNPIVVVISFL